MLKTNALMLWVVLALVPGTALQAWLLGPGTLANLVLAMVACAAAEMVCSLLRRPSLPAAGRAGLDPSSVVTAVLLTLCLPATTSWWIVVSAAVLAIGLGKQIYGGLGQNPFNPAMVGYVIALTAWPAAVSHWPSVASVDALSGATALAASQQMSGLTMAERFATDPAFGHFGDARFEWINLAFLLGGLALLARGVIRWHAPVGFLLGLAGAALLAFQGDSDRSGGTPLLHLASGGTMLCAFFIVTDPASGASTRAGQFWFGLLVGVLSYVIRAFGAHPDGLAYAILIVNAAAPMLDRWVLHRQAQIRQRASSASEQRSGHA